jgi:hypothetical protein
MLVSVMDERETTMKVVQFPGTVTSISALTEERLHCDNIAYDGTYGISRNNASLGFVPAFRDSDTGRVELARFASGRLAPMHLLEGLPSEWAVGRTSDGRICAVKASIVAGFIRNGLFYTREQAAGIR